MKREITVVPHTHWDREWYEPFQTFRLKLVDMVDDLLPLLEADPAFGHFMLDGQMAAVDDYLAVRPGQTDRLRALATSGRLGVGPWYILMDEFLVSGETMVRDLQLGLERAASFGGAMEVGYLPDMFGHIAQMPQLLRQFGFDHAVVWRGVPSSVDRNAFWWEAPDGSTVRAEYLLEGYGNGAALTDDAKDLVDQVARFERDHESSLLGPILWMNGTDHLLPKPWLGRVLAEANDIQDDYEFRVGSLAAYLDRATTDGLPTWRGELRSGARANLLMGVASNRVDIKQAAARAERALERCAEPLSALFLPAHRWPESLLATAWLEMIRNAAHDSSCACSIDEVCEAVEVRYAEARQIADGLTERAVAALAASLAEGGIVVLNPSARPRSGVVELTLAGTDPIEGTQVLATNTGYAASDGITRADTATLVQAATDGLQELRDVEVEIDADGVLEVRLVCSLEPTGPRYGGRAKTILDDAAAEDPEGPARIALVTPPSQTVLARVTDVAGFGWTTLAPTLSPTHSSASPTGAEHHESGVEVRDGTVELTNGLVTVAVDTATGTFSLAAPDGPAVHGLGRLVDDGDAGDTYNYSPPAEDSSIDTPEEVTVSVLEEGPLRTRVRIDRTYVWPEQVFFGIRTGEVETPTTTTVELHAGSPLVRVTTELVNRCRDHRLRVWLPLPEPATSSHAECAFATVERGLTAEGGPNEHGLPTYPSRRFVIAGGLTVVHEGLLEYELTDITEGAAHTLTMTLIRATGMLSNGPMTYRPLPAGPFLAVPSAQMDGPQSFRYALQLSDSVEDAFAAVDEAFLPLVVTRTPGGGDRPAQGTALTVEGAEVSAVIRQAGALVVRVFNPTPDPTTVGFGGRSGWLVDLRGRPGERFEETFALRGFGIATVRLEDPGQP